MNPPAKPLCGVALRWLIGLVLIWAALGKLANPHEFFTTLLAYRLPLPAAFTKAAAIVLPWLELLCGLLLLADHLTSAALAWALVLFAGFTLATGQAWLRGLHISCGCLDLRLIGIRPGSGLGAFLESVRFAFFRALALACAAGFLLAREVRNQNEARGR
ncbi:MAG: MauE/DoxX family redox-associated membrane protein [Chthoniobacteraceae bacterium]